MCGSVSLMAADWYGSRVMTQQTQGSPLCNLGGTPIATRAGVGDLDLDLDLGADLKAQNA